jgi:hypothetical protein
MQQFFDSLRTNLESLEQLPHEDKEALLGQHVVSAAGTRALSSLLNTESRSKPYGAPVKFTSSVLLFYRLINSRAIDRFVMKFDTGNV